MLHGPGFHLGVRARGVFVFEVIDKYVFSFSAADADELVRH